jgi:hypothetical protein
LIALVAVAMVGCGVALAVLLSSGESPRPSTPPTAPGSTIPGRNVTSSPPWGLSGSGWSDYCYRQVEAPPGFTQQRVADTEPCPEGTTQFTGMLQIALTARAGADVDRLGALWGAIQPTPPRGTAPGAETGFDWQPLVRRYRAMLKMGIRPVMVAWGSPGWARPPGWDRPGGCSAPAGAGCAFPPATDHIADWRTFLRGLMVRFPRMRALEIWNEPNSARFFAPRPSPALYARMLRAADQAARRVDFDRPIITGGLAPEEPRHGGKVPPAPFLSRVYQLAGPRVFDGIGAHPYPNGAPWIEKMTRNLDQLRAVRRRFDDPDKPLWITEVGVGGTPSGEGASVRLDEQASILTRMYRSIQGGDVRAFIVYTLYDSPIAGERFGPFGVVSADLHPKPAYCRLARHLGHLDPCEPGGP